jgi:hypothetical protein
MLLIFTNSFVILNKSKLDIEWCEQTLLWLIRNYTKDSNIILNFLLKGLENSIIKQILTEARFTSLNKIRTDVIQS